MQPDLLLIPEITTSPVNSLPWWADKAWEVFYQGEILGRLSFTTEAQLWAFEDKWLGITLSDLKAEEAEDLLRRRPKKDKKKIFDLGIQYQILSRKCKEVADDPMAFDQAFAKKGRHLREIEKYLKFPIVRTIAD